jgi:hypothetical protein
VRDELDRFHTIDLYAFGNTLNPVDDLDPPIPKQGDLTARFVLDAFEQQAFQVG